MKDPILELKVLHISGESTHIFNHQCQYFSENQTYDVFSHEHKARGDKHIYTKIGERNCREAVNDYWFGKTISMGACYRWMQNLSKSMNLVSTDVIVAVFGGYENEPNTAWQLSIPVQEYKKSEVLSQFIDDEVLLEQKMKELEGSK